MDLVTFHERLYGTYNGQLYTFEPTWDSFRPIVGIGWNGTQFACIDDKYKPNLFDELYGYGTLQMKAECRRLTQETELSETREMTDPIQFWRWYGEHNVKWWRDRPCVFVSACVSRDANSWKNYLKYLNTKARTLRQPFRGKSTRRCIR